MGGGERGGGIFCFSSENVTLTDKLIFFFFFIQQKVRSLSIDTGILVSGLVFFFFIISQSLANFPNSLYFPRLVIICAIFPVFPAVEAMA